jgi:glutamate dehydrogenase
MQFNNNSRDSIINQIVDMIEKKLPADQAKLPIDFTRQFYGTVALEDLEARNVSDMFGAVISQCELLSHRKPGETKMRIFNPHYELNGWQSTHTIIEIIQDDMPFLVDSLRMELDRLGMTMHLIIHFGGLKVKRDTDFNATAILPFNTPAGDDVYSEAIIYIEIDRQTQTNILEDINAKLRHVLRDVTYAVQDWSKMRAKVRDALSEIDKYKHKNLKLDHDEIAETKDFLRWLENDHFTFLGYREYKVTEINGEWGLRIVPDTGLGILRNEGQSKAFRTFTELTPDAKKLALSPDRILLISKTNTISTVHRPVYTDYIGVKYFDDKGNLVGEHRFIGLYTSIAYQSNPKHIPFIRRKVAIIMKNSNLSPTGHAGKELLNILETFPRDDLFQAPIDELYEMAMGILHLHERKNIRLFARKDIYGRFMSCLVFIPRERFTTELANQIQDLLAQEFHALEISYVARFGESVLARIHYVVRINPNVSLSYNLKEIEKKIAVVGRSWQDDLKDNLLDAYGEEKGNELYQTFKNAFPAGYRELFTAHSAIYDIEHIEALSETPLAMGFYIPLEEFSAKLRFKLFKQDRVIPLSDALPIFENMGLRVIGERPYEINIKNGRKVWMHDFSMDYSGDIAIDVNVIKSNFQDAFYAIWTDNAENDGFNRLILTANLSWREITIIRAYTKYLRQTGFTYSQPYIEECLNNHPQLAALLVELFHARFDPNFERSEGVLQKIENALKEQLDKIVLLDEDKIIRRYYELILATLRTNFYQYDATTKPNNYLSLKLDPFKISDLPLPLPRYEIFVYSPHFEGVHLRTSKVARGGIRWSDRREDFRTEILGLMKAQNVKNAVIVPSGAKGGFVPKVLPVNGTRDQIMQEVISCYKKFISGLLDITDNLEGNDVIPAPNVVRYDDDDTYLVVAADKGTATFSDIANEIAANYHFWLGDAFASGGSAGYDHKKMGITARGAWESVKRHFRELGLDTQREDFTVVGIGDMAGDVFGNGMLLSEHIKLVGAFNHTHIFIDPMPDPAISFAERKRLFDLPRSSWEDYDRTALSKGGDIFSRTAKAIKLSPEAKEVFGIDKDFVVPNELIRAMLKAPVDLMWNGGIGTFVKASYEDNSAAGDRTNDAIRVNGEALQCRVVAEGGNLGFTQFGRVEYALKGGRINTDFIDNSAGVDCSDHEVNIKILLNSVVENNDLTLKQRNQLLAEMTEQVGALVISDNYHQTLALSLAESRAPQNINLHNRYMQELSRTGQLDLEVEFLPSEKILMERKATHQGLTRPELAVLFAYCKNIIKHEILNSDLPEDQHLCDALQLAFPPRLHSMYKQQMDSHKLHREIIATILSNYLVNEMGFTFVYRLNRETGSSVSDIVRAYTIIRHVFELDRLWHEIEQLDYKIDAKFQLEMMQINTRLIRRATRWILRNRRMRLDITSNINHFSAGVAELRNKMGFYLIGAEKEKFDTTKNYFMEAKTPEYIANQIASDRIMFSVLDIIEAANVYGFDLEEVAKTYFMLSEHLELGWFREQLNSIAIENEWDSLAREACRDDLDWQQRGLTIAVLQGGATGSSVEEKINLWSGRNETLIARWQSLLGDLRSVTTHDFVMFTVAVRELSDLTQTSFHVSMTKQKDHHSTRKNGRVKTKIKKIEKING